MRQIEDWDKVEIYLESTVCIKVCVHIMWINLKHSIVMHQLNKQSKKISKKCQTQFVEHIIHNLKNNAMFWIIYIHLWLKYKMYTFANTPVVKLLKKID